MKKIDHRSKEQQRMDEKYLKQRKAFDKDWKRREIKRDFVSFIKEILRTHQQKRVV